jgi:23S rRNA pseudouridine2605 synthase
LAAALSGAQDAKCIASLEARDFSLTAEQMEAARAERLRQNGRGQLTFEDARTWLEETGLCLFLPRKQFSSFVAPTFVEAVAGERNPSPPAKIVTLAEELLVRLEAENVAVRLNLLGQPGDQPDFVVAAWVLPYVYALRGDRDWRRSPQLTGSRQVSPLAIQTYKLLEQGDATISQLKHALGREVTEAGVLRAITELWQQLRIIPVVSAPGKPAQWQLLRLRYQKAIAEGASTSQVTAISVLASIYLQAVIAAAMEEVELFLAPLTARSKVREVLRGLLATRQVHTIPLGHAPHFYVAGTLPEFATPPTIYASAAMPASTHFLRSYAHDEERVPSYLPSYSSRPAKSAESPATASAASGTPPPARPHFSQEPARAHGYEPAASSGNSRLDRHEARSGASRHVSTARWAPAAQKNGHSKHNGARAAKVSGKGGRFHANGNSRSAGSANGSQSLRKAKSSARTRRTGRAAAKSSVQSSPRPASRNVTRRPAVSRKDVRAEKRVARGKRKPALTASAKAGSRSRYSFTAPAGQRPKKRG